MTTAWDLVLDFFLLFQEKNGNFFACAAWSVVLPTVPQFCTARDKAGRKARAKRTRIFPTCSDYQADIPLLPSTFRYSETQLPAANQTDLNTRFPKGRCAILPTVGRKIALTKQVWLYLLAADIDWHLVGLLSNLTRVIGELTAWETVFGWLAGPVGTESTFRNEHFSQNMP